MSVASAVAQGGRPFRAISRNAETHYLSVDDMIEAFTLLMTKRGIVVCKHGPFTGTVVALPLGYAIICDPDKTTESCPT